MCCSTQCVNIIAGLFQKVVYQALIHFFAYCSENGHVTGLMTTCICCSVVLLSQTSMTHFTAQMSICVKFCTLRSWVPPLFHVRKCPPITRLGRRNKTKKVSALLTDEQTNVSVFFASACDQLTKAGTWRWQQTTEIGENNILFYYVLVLLQ